MIVLQTQVVDDMVAIMQITTHLFNLSLLISLVGSLELFAQGANATKVTLGAVSSGGTGCPSSLSSVLSPDATSLSLIFDNFVVDAGGASLIVRKNCDISIPVQVPTGLSVTLVGADFRGFNNLPLGATSTLSLNYFFSGGTTNQVDRSFFGPIAENYLLQHNVKPSNQPSSSCGASSILRITTSLMVEANSAGDAASATLDSTDLVVNDPGRVGSVIFLTYQACSAGAASRAALSTVLLALTGSALLLL